MDEHLTQRLVELGHLGMIPACCLGLVAGGGQKETDWSEAETLSESLGSLLIPTGAPKQFLELCTKAHTKYRVFFRKTFAKLAYEKGERHFSIHM